MIVVRKYYGFVYIWRDRKHNKFCIGSHLGSLTDGYLSSTGYFIRAYTKRQEDFKRRILSFLFVKDRQELLKLEQYWLDKIKDSELGRRYYNLKRFAAGGNTIAAFTSAQRAIYSAKLSLAQRGEKHWAARSVVCNNILYTTIAHAKSVLRFDPSRKLRARKTVGFYFVDEGVLTPEECTANIKAWRDRMMRGLQRTKAHNALTSPKEYRRRAVLAAATRKITTPDIGNKISNTLKGKPGRCVLINGQIYGKARIAAEALGMKLVTVKARIRNPNFPEWRYTN